MGIQLSLISDWGLTFHYGVKYTCTINQVFWHQLDKYIYRQSGRFLQLPVRNFRFRDLKYKFGAKSQKTSNIHALNLKSRKLGQFR